MGIRLKETPTLSPGDLGNEVIIFLLRSFYEETTIQESE